MVLRIFKQNVGPALIEGDGSSSPPFYFKGVIIGYPLHYIIK